MVTQQQKTASDVIYPDSDGKPMADTTLQFRWILVIEQNIDWLFAADPDVFVAGDLLWYPIEGDSGLSAAPDTMVVFGRPKGYRGSYQQWKEDNIAPQVVFEILSPGNTPREMERKLLFYNSYDVEEYYLYDPYKNQFKGWCRSQERLLDQIEPIEGWVSPRLGIRFELGEELELYRPDGVPFFSFNEISQMLEQERQMLEQERQRAEQESQRAEQESQRADRLAEKLREMGVDPDAL
jgi:Uma2 family endonuclease